MSVYTSIRWALLVVLLPISACKKDAIDPEEAMLTQSLQGEWKFIGAHIRVYNANGTLRYEDNNTPHATEQLRLFFTDSTMRTSRQSSGFTTYDTTFRYVRIKNTIQLQTKPRAELPIVKLTEREFTYQRSGPQKNDGYDIVDVMYTR